MGRKTRQQQEEIVETFYGINPKTFKVESVSRTRGGTLTKWNEDAVPYSHHIEHGRDPKSEVLIVFGLIDIFGVPEFLVSSESTKMRINELKEKAGEMKRQKEAKGQDE